jgi:hypothetical protein
VDQQTFATGYTFENGQVAKEFSPDSINPAMGGAVGAALKNATTCGNLTYSPFPELMKAKVK